MKIKQQLQEYSRRAKMPYAQVVTLYAMERFLYRLSKLKSATFARKPPVPLPPKDLETLMDELVAWLQPPMLESREGKWIPGSGWRYRN